MTQRKRAAIVTGALGGIGRSLCSEFKKAGYFVIATDREGGKVECDRQIEFDIRDLYLRKDARARFEQQIREILKLDSLELNALINNAAIQILGSCEEIEMVDWDVTLQTNLIAPFLLVQSFLPELESACGSVVNVASVHATATKPGFVCYATSKSALVGLTKSLAVDLGSKVRINSICPAATATPMLLAGFEGKQDQFDQLSAMHPIGRIAEPEEIAKTALFLASEAASFITGSCLHIDGGIGGRLHDPV